MSGRLDATTLRRAMALYARALEDHRDELDSLNVFPVPDGDTGTNMLLTQRAVARALEDAGPEELPELCERISQASLLGARGNSGVILSQVLRGACEAVAATTGGAGPDGLAVALARASEAASSAVARPREGTVLTVLREAAGAARAAAEAADASEEGVAHAALNGARAALALTTGMLPELRAAGVVDAGGLGVVLLLDAVRAALRDEQLSEAVGAGGPVGRAEAVAGAGDGAFEVQFLLEGADEALPALRDELGAIGDSLVIVGGGGLFRVHVHTDEPGRVLEAGKVAGATREVQVASLAEDVSRCRAGEAREVRVTSRPTAMVAVVAGDGLVRAFASLGAAAVRLDGSGRGAERVVADLVAAVDALPAGTALILPNDPAALSAAERASGLASKRAVVIPTRSAVAGLAAAAAHNPEASPEDNVAAMTAAAAATASGEVVAGAVDDAAGATVAVARRLANGARGGHGGDPEVLTVIAGAEVSDGELDAVRDALQAAFPDAAVQALAGGMAGPRYLLGVE